MANDVEAIAQVSIPAKKHFKWSHLFTYLYVGFVAFYVGYPIFLILLNSFNEAVIATTPVYSLLPWKEAFSEPGTFEALYNTFKLTFVTQLWAYPPAIFIAWLLARTNTPWSGAFEYCFWIAFFLPNSANTLGWMFLLDPHIGALNQFYSWLSGVEKGPFNIYSFAGLVWVKLFSNTIAIKIMFLTPAFRRMDAALEEASRMSGASNIGTMLRITVPVMVPTILITFLISMLRIFEGFETELLLGTPWGFYVYSTKIAELARAEPPLANQAAALGSITLVLLAIFVPFQQKVFSRRHWHTLTGQIKPYLIDIGKWQHASFALLVLIQILLLGVPLVCVTLATFMKRFGYFFVPNAWTTEYWAQILTDPMLVEATRNTFLLAGINALLSPMTAVIIAYIIVRTKLPSRRALDFFIWMPSAVPGILSGLGLMWMFLGLPFLRPVYGTIYALVIVTILNQITHGSVIMKAALVQLGPELEEASRMSGAGSLKTIFKVTMPLVSQTMVLLAVMSFMFSAQATASIILLASTETRTLALIALDAIMGGRREVASVVVFLITLLTAGVAMVARWYGLRIGLQQGGR